MEQAFKDAAEAVEVMIAEGPDAAMNQLMDTNRYLVHN